MAEISQIFRAIPVQPSPACVLRRDSPFFCCSHTLFQSHPNTFRLHTSVFFIAVVAGTSSSVPDDITDDVTLPPDQSKSSEAAAPGNDDLECCSGMTDSICLLTRTSAAGNTFYLVLPTEQGETATDDLNDPPTPTASHFPQCLEEAMLRHTQLEEPARAAEVDRSDVVQPEQEEETGPLQVGKQSHVIKNVDEIFHTIEGLMTKLRHLKVSVCSTLTLQELLSILAFTTPPHPPQDIETAHHNLLKSLREPSPDQESEDQHCRSATVSRTPSLDRGSGDGEGAAGTRQV